MSSFLNQDAIDALAFFAQWLDFTRDALNIIAPRCPLFPYYTNDSGIRVAKTRPWLDPDGPVGMLLHYTGGPNGIASMRWSNENQDNRGSSWHITILDHRIKELKELTQDYPLVAKFLPVTALLHADIHKGTRHGNWTNNRTIGVEHRNLGMLSGAARGRPYRRSGRRKYYTRQDKIPIYIRNRYWEPYTKDQLVCTINIGKMLRRWRGCKFDPCWVLGHSAVWGSKMDPGIAYPTELIRDAIFSDVPAERIPWLMSYDCSMTLPLTELVEELDTTILDTDRDQDYAVFEKIYEPLDPLDFDESKGKSWRNHLREIRANLRVLGYCILPNDYVEDVNAVEKELYTATNIFQYSTHDPKYKGNKLKVDSIPGLQTRAELIYRLKQFGYNV